ncbi:phosphotransferase [Metabacillus malikii]|uniref:Aminoglycoside 3'-phosphotransferase-2 n=1 Tax=Metabacillus malikii TaxID=1504265 RepID=A0ABT9ZD43_9BACI|nr:phosphotransferase [Metabacillus malikii]MDQ0230176.1 aminoglycoside 3'-phosphotransferase-2 [Metabacillus malikii]
MLGTIKTEIETLIGEIQTIHLIEEQGCTSEVRRVTTQKGTYMIKTAFMDRYRKWLQKEAKVLQVLNGKAIPVPRYNGFIEESHRNHLLMSFENGNTLTMALKTATSTTEKSRLIRSFGLFLNKFHETPPIESLKWYQDWLDEQLNQAQIYVEKGQTDGTIELLNKLMANKPLPVKQTMIHGDCTTDNVLVLDGKVQRFIDVAGMAVGDPRYDVSLAIGHFSDNPLHLKAFYDGYTRYKVTEREYQYFNDGLYEFF